MRQSSHRQASRRLQIPCLALWLTCQHQLEGNPRELHIEAGDLGDLSRGLQRETGTGSSGRAKGGREEELGR